MARGNTPGGLTRKERLLRHVDVAEDECWEWRAFIRPNGYGQFNKNEYAHRVSYEEFVGPIPEGLVIDHLCRNRSCINPEHLEPVTQHENLLRGNGWAGQRHRANLARSAT